MIRAQAMTGLGQPVPTCPGWTMRDLVVHVGMAHRWCLANLAGKGPGEWPTEASVAAEAAAAPDLLDWFDEGLVEVLHTLASSPADLTTFFFLKDAPRHREAWARRQCHETTIHGVDAMAAKAGRVPTPDQTWITADLAADGVDELLMGFVPRKSSTLRTAEPVTALVRATDVDRAWTLRLSAEPPVVTTGDIASQADSTPDVVVEGGAVELYLGLWNRGELRQSGRHDLVGQWREQQRVVWS